jgi:DNA-binding HxlR family transcriptional regulator
MLTERLADLQAVGLIAAVSEEDGGEYRLSARGESLRPVLQALYDLGEVQASELRVTIRPLA